MKKATVKMSLLAGIMAACFFPGVSAPAAGQASEHVMALRGKLRVEPAEGSLLSKTAALAVKGVTVSEALTRLSTSASISVAFSPSSLPQSVRVDCECQEVTIAEALDQILSTTEFGYLELGDQIVIAKRTGRETMGSLKSLTERWAETNGSPLLSPSRSTHYNGSAIAGVQVQETGVIVGQVTEAASGRPLSGVQMAVEGTSLGTLTNDEGNFVIPGVPAGTRTVRAILLGYREETRTVTVQRGSTAVLNLALGQAVISMDELVVTGTMTPTSLKAVSHPVNIVTASDIEALGVRRFDEIIRLTVPAVKAYAPSTGSAFSQYPAGATGFSFRGSTVTACWDCSDAKVFVDGIEVAIGAFSANSLFHFTADQIERIEVIRGPQASALYGSDALGGVVQIFTKRGQGATRPQVSVTTEIGRMEKLFGSGGVPRQYHAASVTGGTGEASYRLGASYTSIGEYSPDYSDQSPNLDAGVRFEQGRFLWDLMARMAQSKTNWGYNPEMAELAAGTSSAESFGPTNKRSMYRLQTFAGKLGFQATPWWRHELTAGLDRIEYEAYKRKPTLYTPADTLVNYDNSQQRKVSFTFRSAAEFPIGEELKATLTAGGDHQRWVHDYWYALQAASTEPLVPLSGPSAYVIAQRTNDNTGFYGQAQLDVRNSVFLNAALRAERRTMNGIQGENWPLVGKFGATYARNVGSTTFKIRASYGSSVRQNHLLNSLGDYRVLTNGWTRTTLPNPDLKPERQDGYDLGLDAIIGGRVSINITYYNQEMKDFIQANVLEDYPDAVWQYENIALVRNKGLEIEGALDLGRVNIRGNFGTISSKPEDLGAITPQPGREVGKQLWFVPENSAALAVTVEPIDRTRISANVSRQGSMFGLEYKNRNKCRVTNSPEYCPQGEYTGSSDWWMDLPSVTTVNLTVEREFSRATTAYLKVDDLTNSWNDFSGFGNLYFPRTITVGVRARY